MEQNKRQKDRGAGKIVLGAFVVALVLAIGWVVISQSGVVPGDAPTQQVGIGPGTVPDAQ